MSTTSLTSNENTSESRLDAEAKRLREMRTVKLQAIKADGTTPRFYNSVSIAPTGSLGEYHILLGTHLLATPSPSHRSLPPSTCFLGKHP